MTERLTIKTEWDLSPLLAGDDDPLIEVYRKQVTEAAERFETTWRQRNDYLESPPVLADALDELEAFERMAANGRDYYYFGLRTSVDAANPKLKARETQSVDFLKDIVNRLQFFWLNVGNIEQSRQPEFLDHERLAPYRHWLEVQFRAAAHRLSEAEEKILMLKSTPSHSMWVQMTTEALAKDERDALDENGKPVKATEEQLLSLMLNRKKNVRDAAVTAFNELLSDHVDGAVAELNAILNNKKIDDGLRGYGRPDQSRHHSDDIDTEVVDALVKAVASRFDISHRYYKLRAKLFGLDKLAYHEKNLDYGDEGTAYDFDASAKLVHDVFTELDPQFGQIFADFLANGQIDVFPKKGKVGGAFCAHVGIEHPTYVLLNHQNKLRDVMTIAHEMGHAINNELIRAKQNALNFGTPTSTAEVASTFMEDFVVDRLFKEADPEMELTLRVRQLDDAVATIFRQIAFYRFEQDLHRAYREQGYLDADAIGELFRKNLDAQLGPVFNGVHDAKNWWIYVSHFRSFFYVYSYSSGLLISKAMQRQVRQDKQFVGQVKTFLSAGLSQSPKDIFASMGIDIANTDFWANGLKEVEQQVIEAEELAKKLGKI